MLSSPGILKYHICEELKQNSGQSWLCNWLCGCIISFSLDHLISHCLLVNNTCWRNNMHLAFLDLVTNKQYHIVEYWVVFIGDLHIFVCWCTKVQIIVNLLTIPRGSLGCSCGVVDSRALLKDRKNYKHWLTYRNLKSFPKLVKLVSISKSFHKLVKLVNISKFEIIP